MRTTLHLREHIALIIGCLGGALSAVLAVVVFLSIEEGGRTELARFVASSIVAGAAGLMFTFWSLLAPFLPKRYEQAMLANLSQQLEQEFAAREAAEVEAADLRRAMDEDHAARGAAEREAAESAAEKYGDWLREQQRRDALLEQQAAQLEQERAAREAAERRAEQAEAEAKAKPSHPLTIAALLELLSEPSRSGRNQSAVLAEILERHPSKRGLGKRSLDDIFAAANKAMKDAA
ncbi:hypothetical protein D3C78_920500 [compost metagenome]